ncbi:MAG: NarK/NasA family nitrate transporter [Polyangiaceae bacterium]|nr:NarK/NasA family nitrate transporter [Polyangiaceae bacterium]
MTERGKALSVLTLNTLAFTVCFAVWMMNGVLVTFLVENKVFAFDKVQIGWLMGIPVLTGSIIRLPVGIATDRYGGKPVFAVVMLASALSAFLLSYATTYGDFVAGSLGFGLSGTGFAVGIAYTSVWFKTENQGTALGVFGVGNAGSALTSMGAPVLLKWFTNGGADLEGWRMLPRVYAGALVVMTVAFLLLAYPRKVEGTGKTLAQQLAPLKSLRVWRFGLYYFLVFGGFVALAQWLIPYYVSAYGTSVALAGLLAAIFSLPSGLIRALGGWMSDKLGARTTLYWVLGVCAIFSLLLVFPRMDVSSPGEGVMAARQGTVTAVTDREIVVGDIHYAFTPRPPEGIRDEGALILPRTELWQEPVVAVGDTVQKKQLLARGVTHIFFQANIWIFTLFAFVIGIAMGIGKAAVYKYIPDYFPGEVGVVGGIVGVLGGLGGFFCPILFGYLLKQTGLWTTTWMVFFVLSLVCLVWLHLVVRKMEHTRAPHLSQRIDDHRDQAAAGHAAARSIGGPAAAEMAGG